jgi:predicted SnoaL-like aldol condensation-catalyzing enzyme
VTYKIGFIISQGDLVMVHGRYTGIGLKPMVAVDIFRIVKGKIAEYCGVLQEEVTTTVSGNSMFDPNEGK